MGKVARASRVAKSVGIVTDRLRIALAVVLCLLFQQIAVAAYACTIPNMPPDPVAMTEDCSSMEMEVVQEAPALCAKHCSPDHAVTADLAAPHVPPLALPPLLFEPVLASPRAQIAFAAHGPIDHSGPPPRLRYCSLLI